MAYAGNQVNTQAALQNYINASSGVQNSILARGAAQAQGIKDMVTMPIQAYISLKQTENQTKDVESTAQLRGEQAKLTSSNAESQDITNKTLDKQNLANISHTQAQTNQLNATAQGISLDNKIKQPQASTALKIDKEIKSGTLDAAFKSIAGKAVNKMATGDTSGMITSQTTAPAQNTKNTNFLAPFFSKLINFGNGEHIQSSGIVK